MYLDSAKILLGDIPAPNFATPRVTLPISTITRKKSSILPTAPKPIRTLSEKVCADEGAANVRPANSPSAIEYAVRVGAGSVFLNVFVTADGVAFPAPILSGPKWEKLPWSKLAGTQIFGALNTHDSVAKLADIILKFPGTHFVLRPHSEKAVLAIAEVINATDSASQVSVTGAWDSWLETIRELTTPLLQRSLGHESTAAFIAAVKKAQEQKHSVLISKNLKVGNWIEIPAYANTRPLMADLNFAKLAVQAAHGLGIYLRVTAIENFTLMADLLELGVDEISSSQPKQVRELFESRKRKAEINSILGF
ncbi:MAG: hypothetical protein SPG61_03055 [Arcanobacterium sp.]|nr:hypothetical protein [Arcanobacterium sp.]